MIVALYPIVKESFDIYCDITEILTTFLEQFKEMKQADCVKVYDIFCRIGKQLDELDLFYCWSKSIGIARSTEYPEIERISTKQLEIMDEYIKDMSRGKIARIQEENNEEQEVKEPEEDVNAVEPLLPPERIDEQPEVEVEKEEPIKEEPIKEEQNAGPIEVDLLHLGDDVVTIEEQGDKFALALFDSAAPVTATTTHALPWHAFDDEPDWETVLVQSASNLANQKPALGGGFDTLLLDGMYRQAETTGAMQQQGFGVSGSASSVALGSAGKPSMLALPAPPTSGSTVGSGSANVDPFAASLSVAPPPYVQMSELEKKQRLLMEEQVLWQQYSREGMHGEVALARLQNNAFPGLNPQQRHGNHV